MALVKEKLATFIEDSLSNGDVIERAQDIVDEFQRQHQIKVKIAEVRRVMRS